MTHKKNNVLSEDGEIRRKEMIAELKSSLVVYHQGKQRRNFVLGVAASVLIVALGVWQFSGPKSPMGITKKKDNHPATIDSTRDKNDSPSVSVPVPQLQFDKVSDEEILALLDEAGQSSVLAEIDNKWVAIPLRPTSNN